MRCFIAINIGDEVKKALGDLQKQLQRRAHEKNIIEGTVKWVSVNNIHLTLKFLGEVRDRQIPEICNIVKKVAAKYKKFNLRFTGAGHFGGRIARVLWVSSGEGANELEQMQNELEEELANAGWSKEARKFAAHLTLCRIKNSKSGIEFAEIIKEYSEYEVGMTKVGSITVYQSQLAPSGPIYTVLGNYKLK